MSAPSLPELKPSLVGTKPLPPRGTEASRWWLLWVCLLAGCAPLVLLYLSRLWKLEHYQFFPFAFVAVGVLVYQRWDGILRAPNGWICWFAIAMGLVANMAAVSLGSPWLAVVAFLIFAASFLTSLSGPRDSTLATAVLPLCLILRLPLRYDSVLIVSLQRVTTDLSSVVLDLLALPHAVDNNIIKLATRELFVAEACSGIQSVFTLMFLSTVFLVFNRRPFWLVPAYLVSAIALALAANVIRVSSVAVADVWFGVDWAQGWQHELLGYAVLLGAALMMMSVDAICVAIFHEMEPGQVGVAENPLIDLWNRFVAVENPGGGRLFYRLLGVQSDQYGTSPRQPLPLVLAVAFVLCGGVLAAASAGRVLGLHTMDHLVAISTDEKELIWEPQKQMFDGICDHISLIRHEASRDGSNPRLGHNADSWDATLATNSAVSARSSAQIVISQPYAGWHELAVCYDAYDWILLNRSVISPSNDNAVQSPNNRVEPKSEKYALARYKVQQADTVSHIYLFYTGFNE